MELLQSSLSTFNIICWSSPALFLLIIEPHHHCAPPHHSKLPLFAFLEFSKPAWPWPPRAQIITTYGMAIKSPISLTVLFAASLFHVPLWSGGWLLVVVDLHYDVCCLVSPGWFADCCSRSVNLSRSGGQSHQPPLPAAALQTAVLLLQALS